MIYSENNLEYVAALLGTMFPGLRFCTIPPSNGTCELSEQIRGSTGTVLAFGSDKVGNVEKACDEAEYAKGMTGLKVINLFSFLKITKMQTSLQWILWNSSIFRHFNIPAKNRGWLHCTNFVLSFRVIGFKALG